MKITWADVAICVVSIVVLVVVAPTFTNALFLIIGVLIGRIYGWMKYHYEEFQEDIKLKVARKRAERYRYEYEIDRARGLMDDEIERRLR